MKDVQCPPWTDRPLPGMPRLILLHSLGQSYTDRCRTEIHRLHHLRWRWESVRLSILRNRLRVLQAPSSFLSVHFRYCWNGCRFLLDCADYLRHPGNRFRGASYSTYSLYIWITSGIFSISSVVIATFKNSVCSVQSGRPVNAKKPRITQDNAAFAKRQI